MDRRADTELCLARRSHHRVCGRRNDQPHRERHEDDRRANHGKRGIRLPQRHACQRRREPQQADDHRRRGTKTRREPRRCTGTHNEPQRYRRGAHARLQRTVPLHQLQVLREAEDHAEQRKERDADGESSAREARPPEVVEVEQRMPHPRLAREKSAAERQRGREAASDRRVSPAACRRLDDRKDEQRHDAHGKNGARQVERGWRRIATVGNQRQPCSDCGRHDR